ncbi:acyl-CoA dehydrogenase family protein [Hymenobacter siberiensis]|uniref:acyl-CoA dehydrogenase family protein n=1 Tax=Hymenobacter siberiensis TaxID=2848396 RepID=UPI001C1DE56A|nr:acyl-CoA dehydrogenase family protein [Hymenobacter siberiensis]MBU6123192.1 hypothetical protein [Hymenobacter siberiensis]
MGRVFEGHTNALLLIQQLATAAQVAGYAADARAGRLFGVWNTENPADGVHLKDLPNGRYRLRGAKTFASGAGQLARPLITGALPHGQGWQLFVLPADAQPPALDRSFWQPIGMRATASFRADLTGLKIGPEDLIGPPNAYYQQPAFSGGAIRFAAVQLGGAEAAFDETRDFLRSLGRTDDPYQRQRLGEMAIMLESGRQWLRGGAKNAARPSAATPEGAEATVAYANMMRTAIETINLEILRLAGQPTAAVLASDGTMSHPSWVLFSAPARQAVRAAEFRHALTILGADATEPMLLALPDGGLPDGPNKPGFTEAVARLREFLKCQQAATVLVP